jgi:hypothetical protein
MPSPFVSPHSTQILTELAAANGSMALTDPWSCSRMPTPQGWLHLSEGAPNCTYEFPQAEASRFTIEFMYLGRLYHARRSKGKSDIFVPN